MKVVSTDGLTKLIQLSKDNFIDKNDVIDMTSVFATVATTGDYEDLTNKPEEIPSQSGQSGKYLSTNGTTVSWASVPSNLPSQSGQSGKYLTTNGTSASWANVPTEIPSQTGNSGKFLTTNGSAVSWATVDALPSQSGQSGKVLTTNGSTASWTNFPTVDQNYSGTSTNAQSGVAVKSAIDSAISSVYKPEGSIAFANRPALSSSIEGYVYNITDSFTTTSDFVEGAGKTYPAGTNIVCINTSGSTYKWDVLAGFVDLSGYQTLIDSTHKLSADLVDDTSTTHKFVTASDKTTWSGKQDALVSGTNIKTINSTSLLGSGDISITGLPSQTSQSGKYLTTNGTTASWADVPTEIPSQSGNSGKFLTTNGTAVSWATVDALPSQTSQSGKFLTTNGSTASWASIPNELPSQSGQSGKFLTTNGSTVSWATVSTGSEEDNLSITKNASDKIQTVGVINQANSASAIKTWSGTLAQYNALATHDSSCLYYITDDTSAGTISSGGDDRFTRGVSKIAQSTLFEFDKTTHTFTLKAGSVVFNPMGKNSSDVLQVHETQINSDITYAPSDLSSNLEYIVYNIEQQRLEHIPVQSTRTTSDGTTDLATCIAYNKTTNYIRKTEDTGSTWSADTYSFPIAIVQPSSGQIQSIEKVFQSASCIGTYTFFRAGYTLRFPNGIDSETKLPKFIETSLEVHRLCEITGNFSVYAELDDEDLTTQYVALCNNALVYEQELEPDYRSTMLWYNPNTNYWYFTTDSGSTWSVVYLCYLTHINQLATNYVSSFNPIAEATTLTTNDIRMITHWGFPGKWRTGITPTNGGIYTAPGDGWFYLSVNRTEGTSDAYAMITGWETNYKVSSSCPSVDGNSSTLAAVIMPVSTGCSVIMNFSGTVNECSFYYCNGSYIA